eukprot:1024193-Pleurochrysis_carterae.AAC.1
MPLLHASLVPTRDSTQGCEAARARALSHHCLSPPVDFTPLCPRKRSSEVGLQPLDRCHPDTASGLFAFRGLISRLR